MSDRLHLSSDDRVELADATEATPARLLQVGEVVWITHGLHGVVVEADPTIGAVVEIVQAGRLGARQVSWLVRRYGNIDVPATLANFFTANTDAGALLAPALFKAICDWMNREQVTSVELNRAALAGILTAESLKAF